MLYHWFEFNRAMLHPARMAAKTGRYVFHHPLNPVSQTPVGRSMSAMFEVFERATRQYGKPEFELDKTVVDGKTVAVKLRKVWRGPFCRVLHFERSVSIETRKNSPRVLLIAPMSGHYATLLRGTVERFLPHAEVYITDWIDARMVPTYMGSFHLDDYISYLIDIFSLFEGNVHPVAVCQPSVPLLAAVSHMEAEKSPHVPFSMTLMGGPIDTRVNPTAVNKLAEDKNLDWFESKVLATVPWTYPGAGRRVYPGFLQLSSFMSMNFDTHAESHHKHFIDLVRGDDESAEKHKSFYDEYLAVMDLTAEFYLETVERVFKDKLLPKGKMTYKGKLIDPGKITRVPLMTVEGELDDITGVGQCRAAHDLCDKLPASKKVHYEQAGVGHYGIFNGGRFRKSVFPEIFKFIENHEAYGKKTRSKRASLETLKTYKKK